MIPAVDVTPVTRNGAQSDARRELSNAIYHRDDDPWPVRAFKAVEHWLGSLLDGVARHAPGGGAGAFGLVVAIVVLLAIARWRLGPMQRTHRSSGPLFDEVTLSAADHRAAAERAGAQADWPTAVRERMRAIAAAVEEAGMIDPRPGRTAAELARAVAEAEPSATGVIAAAAATFDLVVYGGRPADRTSYDRVVACDDALSRTGVAAR